MITSIQAAMRKGLTFLAAVVALSPASAPGTALSAGAATPTPQLMAATMLTTAATFMAAATDPTVAGAQQVSFTYDATRMSDISVRTASILGDSVGTGGIYLIGSFDGSDAHGKSVTSTGAQNGLMKADSPSVPRPPYRLVFQRTSSNTVHYYAQVGPMPARFAVMSFALDFGKQSVSSFSFNGSRYLIQGIQNGWRNGSGTTYSSIPAVFPITNQQGVLLGYVGVASTKQATTWGEVDGEFGSVLITVTRSSHYIDMDFVNHFGTNGVGLTFGAMNQGETAFLEGDIVVTPRTWVFDAVSSFYHQIGRPDGGGWSANVTDTQQRYLCFGPYTTAIPAGVYTATWRLMLDNVTADDLKILTIDVRDANSGQILASQDIRRKQFSKAFSYQAFRLNFTVPAHAMLEFRTFWHGYSYSREESVTVN